MTDAALTVQLESWRGFSAYEIAVQNGFEGTQAQWLESLRGRDGAGVTINGLAPVEGDIALCAGDIPMEAGSVQSVRDGIAALVQQAVALTQEEVEGVLEG